MGASERPPSSDVCRFVRLCRREGSIGVESKGERRLGGGSHYHQENFISQQPTSVWPEVGWSPRGYKAAELKQYGGREF